MDLFSDCMLSQCFGSPIQFFVLASSMPIAQIVFTFLIIIRRSNSHTVAISNNSIGLTAPKPSCGILLVKHR